MTPPSLDPTNLIRFTYAVKLNAPSAFFLQKGAIVAPCAPSFRFSTLFSWHLILPLPQPPPRLAWIRSCCSKTTCLHGHTEARSTTARDVSVFAVKIVFSGIFAFVLFGRSRGISLTPNSFAHAAWFQDPCSNDGYHEIFPRRAKKKRRDQEWRKNSRTVQKYTNCLCV